MVLGSDELNNRVYVKSIVGKKSASKLFSSLPATRNKIQGFYIVEIDGDCIFKKDEATASLSTRLHNQGSDSFAITFATKRNISAKAIRTSSNEYNIYAPNTKWDTVDDAEIGLINSKFLLPKKMI